MNVVHLALMLALQAPKAPPAAPPAPLHNPLIIPEPETNLSAFRLDAEIFGWNKAYTEVGVLAMEMVRDAYGAHRGETYMLVYPTRSTTPKHNVICHFITHVALPENPIPLEVAGDYMWTIEWSYQNMWPRRPKHHRPKGGMAVTPLWAPMPPEDHVLAAQAQGVPGRATAATSATPAAAAREAAVRGPMQSDASPPGSAHPTWATPAAPAPFTAGSLAAHIPVSHPVPPLRQHRSVGTCQPWVGFRLQRGKEVRLHPYQPVDLSARCELLQLTDSRTYWGTQDIAASMVRFDFNAAPKNEESARFVVSALWSQGKQVRFVVVPSASSTAAAHQAFKAHWARVLSPWGRVLWRRAKKPPASGAEGGPAPQQLLVHAHTHWLPLARSLAADAGHPDAAYRADDTLSTTIVLDFASARAPGTKDGPLPLVPAQDLAPHPSGMPDSPQSTQVPQPPERAAPAAPSRYLQDFKVP